MMIGTNKDGVVMDMQAANVARNNIRGVEEAEEVLATKVEQMEAIVDIESLENGEEALVKLD
jgi:hypothetical protein